MLGYFNAPIINIDSCLLSRIRPVGDEGTECLHSSVTASQCFANISRRKPSAALDVEWP